MDDKDFNAFTLEAYRARLAGMVAANEDRARRGEAQAYPEDAFFNLENEILTLRNSRG